MTHATTKNVFWWLGIGLAILGLILQQIGWGWFGSQAEPSPLFDWIGGVGFWFLVAPDCCGRCDGPVEPLKTFPATHCSDSTRRSPKYVIELSCALGWGEYAGLAR